MAEVTDIQRRLGHDPKVRNIVGDRRLLVVSEETIDADLQRYADGGFDGVYCTADLLRYFPGDPYADVTIRHDEDRQALLARSDLTRLSVGGPHDGWVPIDLSNFSGLVELGLRMHRKTVLPRAMPNLRWLHIDRYAPLSPETTLPDELPELRTLRLAPEGATESLPPLPRAPKLESFELMFSRAVSLAGVEGYPTIRELRVDQQSRLTDIGAVAKLELLEDVQFNTCRRLADYSPLGSCRKLRRLSIVNSPRVQSIGFLRNCPGLAWFHSWGTNIVDGDLTPLIGVPEVSVEFRRHYSPTAAQLRELTTRQRRGETPPLPPAAASVAPAAEGPVLPTSEWLPSPDETGFPAEGVQSLHDRLRGFVEAVDALPRKASRRKVLDLVKGVVLDIGEIHERYGSFLDTGAREELVGFIHEVVSEFNLGDGEDLTERWRRW